MRVGANSAALETRWTQQDVQNVAEMRGLDLRDEAQMQQALEVVDAAHNRIAQDYGIDDAIERRAASAEAETDAIADYEARFPDGDTRMADEISADARRAQEQEDAELDAATDAMIQMQREAQDMWENSDEVQIPVITGDGERLEMTEAQIRAAVEHDADLRLESPVDENDLVPNDENIAALREYHEQQRRENAIDYDAHGDPDYLGNQAEAQFNRVDTADQMARSREADALEHAPTTSIGSTEAARHELRQYANPVGADDERRLREAVERALTRDEIERLKRGDVDGLNGVGSREEQLAMARDYLRSTNDPTAQQGLDRVNEQLAAEREQQRRERGHEGGGHE